MENLFYVIKLTFLIGPSKGKTGYHSVWADKAKAEDYAKTLNKEYKRELYYEVVEEVPVARGSNWHNKSLVKFKDSLGFLEVQK